MVNSELMQAIEKIMPEIIEIRRSIHRNPEIGRKEIKTTALIKEKLLEFGADEILSPMPTGAVALIHGNGKGNTRLCAAVRSDIDALPVQEETGLPFASEIPGMMHACGHDMHTAMLLGAAKILCDNRDSEREKALEAALNQIQKQFGKGAIMKLGDKNAQMNIDVISTGSISLDVATGVGGVPKGRIVEIYGPESSGKTTLTLHIIAEAQKNGGKAAFIDAEHALDPVYARNLGVDTENLLVSQPDTGEQALEICDMLVRSGALDIVVIDSVAALVPKAEIQGEMGDAHVGLQARLMSQALRKITGSINRSNTCVIFINQLREKVGVMYGSPEVTTGGRALKFYASMRLDVRKVETIKSGDSILGNRTKVKIVKNKVAPPFKQAEFDIMYGEGISKEGDILDASVDAKLIEKSGSWYSYKGQRIGQGRENIKIYLKENPDIVEELHRQLLELMKNDGEAPVKEKEPEVSEDEFSEIMDVIIDEDGVVIE